MSALPGCPRRGRPHPAHRVDGQPCEPDDCGSDGSSCLSLNQEAGRTTRCSRHQVERDAEDARRAQAGRDNYCRMFGHDLRVARLDDSEPPVLHCSNRCSVDGAYALVPREGAES